MRSCLFQYQPQYHFSSDAVINYFQTTILWLLTWPLLAELPGFGVAVFHADDEFEVTVVEQEARFGQGIIRGGRVVGDLF